jgi:hypothetical protein
MADEIRTLPLALLRLDFQPEENIDYETVEAFAQRLRDGERIEPVRVFFDGQTYWLNDGFHRVFTARKLGIQQIEAEVHFGTYQDMEDEWRDFLAAAKKKNAEWAEQQKKAPRVKRGIG